MSDPLRRLAAALRDEGGLSPVRAPRPRRPGGARRAGLRRAPRRAPTPRSTRSSLEAIHEGYLLHYGTPRVVTDAEPDLALLAGDRLYALGLARLAALGDTEAVAELADVIALSAAAHAAGDPALAAAAWRAGARPSATAPRRPMRRPRRPPGPAILAPRRPSKRSRATWPEPAPGLAPDHRVPGGMVAGRRRGPRGPGHRFTRHIPMADPRKPKKSPYTLDRGVPGAFEGETITRRRL